MRPSYSLILPSYQAAAFLERSLGICRDWMLERGREHGQEGELILVDDGSTDATPRILEEFAASWDGPGRFRVLRNDPNMGKGFAVRRGMLAAEGELLLFTDVDLTYPIRNLEVLLEALAQGADLAYADRHHPETIWEVPSDLIGYVHARRIVGRIFNRISRMLVLPGVRDTQAGLKGFRREAAQRVFVRGDRHRFSFDVELLYVAHRLGLRMQACPVHVRYHREPTTVRFGRDSMRMFLDMIRIRWRGMRGRYDEAVEAACVLEHPACQPEGS